MGFESKNLTPPANPPDRPASPAHAVDARSHLARQSSTDVPRAELHALAAANADFAFDLCGVLASPPDNLFFSSHRITAALAMTSAGASGETASQMDATLHLPLPPNRLLPAFNALAQQLESQPNSEAYSTPFELRLANALWGEAGFDYLPDFLDLLAADYDAGIRRVGFSSDPKMARQAITTWIEEAASGKVMRQIPEGTIDNLTRLNLVNAIFFKADSVHPFDASATTPVAFTRLDDSTVEAAMMHQIERFAAAVMG